MATTKTQARAQSKDEYNAYLAVCPSRQLLDRISSKWVVLILCALGGDTPQPGDQNSATASLRYSELSRLLVGVSQKMLTQTLRSLERDGLVMRTAAPTVPVTVSYELTSLGRSLYELTRGIRHWAQDHMAEVNACRDQFDAKASSSSTL